MFDLIINPIVTLMVFFYDLLGNQIVLSIALVTVLIRLAVSPLMISQQRSTRAMQEVQPELNKLREKYKNDREKLAQEQMRLFREHGVNPLGGCLPLLVQLPILLALYRAINAALASTPFELVDLSDRLLFHGFDGAIPLNNFWLGMDLTLPPTANPAIALSLPLLVMITTWLQSRLTIPPTQPSAGDDPKANQAAQMTRTMTTVMPLMFGFFSLSFSVGLSIYFFVSNVVGIVQYTMMGKAEWRRLLGLGDEKAEPAVAGNGKPPEAETRKSKSKREAREEEPVPIPTRPSGRKNKKMKRASSGETK